MRLFQTIWESCWIEDKASDWGGEKVQKRFLLAEQGSPPQYCFKKVVIQKLSSTECSLEFVLTEEKKTELGLGEQYSERRDARRFFTALPPLLSTKIKNSKEPTRGLVEGEAQYDCAIYDSEFDHNLGHEKCPGVLLTNNLLQDIRNQMTGLQNCFVQP